MTDTGKPSVGLRIRLERRVAPRRGTQCTLDFMVEVNPENQPQQGTRGGINLCLVLDRSGSMAADDKLNIAKDYCRSLYKRLANEDQLCVVAFSDDAEVIFDPDDSKDAFEAKITELVPEGCTNLSEGWRLGVLELNTFAGKESAKRLVLVSDGLANQGETKMDVLAAEAERASATGISTSCIGVGADFEEELLRAMAEASHGNFWLADEGSFDDVLEVEFGGALSTLIERPRLSLTIPPGAILQPMNRLRQDVDGRYRLSALRANKTVRFAWRIKVPIPSEPINAQNSITATLFDGVRVVSEARATFAFGDAQEVAESIMDAEVTREIKRFKVLQSEERAIAALRDDSPGSIPASVHAMRAARDTIYHAQAESVSPHIFDADARQLALIEDLLTILADLSGGAFSTELRAELLSPRIASRLRKLLTHQAHKHGARNWDTQYDVMITERVVKESVAELEETLNRILVDRPEFYEEVEVVLRALNNLALRVSKDD